MARRVADVRAALKVLSGAHPRDPWSIDAPSSPARGVARIRVAVVAEPPGGATAPEVSAIVRRAADALADAGYEIVDAAPPRYEEAVSLWARLLIGDFGTVLDKLLPLMGETLAASSRAPSAACWTSRVAALSERAWSQRDGVARAWAQFFAHTPLVLSPTWTQLPFEVGADVATTEGLGATVEMMRPVVLVNPSRACRRRACWRIFDVGTGVPVGVLLTGARFADEICLDAAEALERRFALPTPIDPARGRGISGPKSA